MSRRQSCGIFRSTQRPPDVGLNLRDQIFESVLFLGLIGRDFLDDFVDPFLQLRRRGLGDFFDRFDPLLFRRFGTPGFPQIFANAFSAIDNHVGERRQ